jgi:hypothetical protein
LLRKIDSAAGTAVRAVSGDAAISRVLLLSVTGLVQPVRYRRLSLFQAKEDLKRQAKEDLKRPVSADMHPPLGVTGLDQSRKFNGR